MIAESKTKDACLLIAKEILSHFVFMRTFKLCLKNESIPKTNTVVEIMRRCGIVSESPATEKRRAASIRDWVIWIVSLPYDMPIE